MYSNNNLAKETIINLKEHFGDKLFKNMNQKDEFIVIPRNVKLAESPSFGKPIILYDPKSVGANTYKNLARSIIRKFQ